MKAIVASRSFALADLGCALLSGAILYSRQGILVREANEFQALSGFTRLWPLLIALLPCLIRLAAGQFPVHRTAFDLFLIFFIATAGLGVWAAYDPTTAWSKLASLLGAVFIFYALAGQPEENLWLSAGLLSLAAALISVGFLLGYDFQSQSADLLILNRLGLAWASARPVSISQNLSPNLAGGVLASLVSFPVAIAAYAWQGRLKLVLAGALLAAGVIGFGLVLTSSRGAWIALLVALGFFALWRFSRLPARSLGLSQEAVFALAVFLIALPLAGILATRPGILLQLANTIPGVPSGSSRLELARNSLYLIADFPFTGGGLGAFAGLYSQYIQVIPFFFFGYSHNLYLDVALEQGVLALIALIVILGASLYFLRITLTGREEKDPFSLLRYAVLVGLIVFGFHGLVDDAFYAGQAVPLLFFLPAFAVALLRTVKFQERFPISPSPKKGFSQKRTNFIATTQFRRINLPVTGLVALILIGLLAASGRSILARFYSNLGAVQMARAELAGYPTGRWDIDRTRRVIESLPVQAAMASFNRSIQLEPDNVTARSRLGLIAFGKGDFQAAILQLKRANESAPSHRGIRKVLGYVYTWTGQLDSALELLVQVPEAQNEMQTYSWWWQEQGREDLSQFSTEMALRLAEGENHLK